MLIFRSMACVQVLVLLLIGALPLSVSADEYPTKPIRLVTGGGAGGLSDILTRLVGDALREQLGQSVIVDNRPGGMNMIAYQAVIAAPPDGYTILCTATSDMTV